MLHAKLVHLLVGDVASKLGDVLECWMFLYVNIIGLIKINKIGTICFFLFVF